MNKVVLAVGVVGVVGFLGYHGATAFASQEAKKEVDKVLAEINAESPHAQVSDYDSVRVNLFTGTTSIKGIEAVNEDGKVIYRIKALETSDIKGSDEIPDSMYIKVNDFEIVDEEVIKSIQKNASYIDKYVFDAQFNYKYTDTDVGDYEVSVSMDIDNVIEVESEVKLKDIKNAWKELKLATLEKRQPDVNEMSPMLVSLESAKVVITDNGIVNRQIAMEAKDKDISEDELKEMIRERMTTNIQLPESLRNALIEFAENPGSTLTLQVKPEQRMPIASMGQIALMTPDRDKVAESFGFTVETKQ